MIDIEVIESAAHSIQGMVDDIRFSEKRRFDLIAILDYDKLTKIVGELRAMAERMKCDKNI